MSVYRLEPYHVGIAGKGFFEELTAHQCCNDCPQSPLNQSGQYFSSGVPPHSWPHTSDPQNRRLGFKRRMKRQKQRTCWDGPSRCFLEAGFPGRPTTTPGGTGLGDREARRTGPRASTAPESLRLSNRRGVLAAKSPNKKSDQSQEGPMRFPVWVSLFGSSDLQSPKTFKVAFMFGTRNCCVAGTGSNPPGCWGCWAVVFFWRGLPWKRRESPLSKSRTSSGVG